MKNGLSRSEQRTGSRTQKQPLDRKSPIQVTCEPDFLDQIRKFVKCSGAIVPVELLPDLVPRINVDSGDFAAAWQRAVAALGVGCLLFISWHSRQGRSRKGLLWLIGVLSGFTVAAVSGAGVSAYAALALATIALWGFDMPGSGTGAVH